jgi:2-polyprenyl-3-methyl-5-hydroxy-6-metoxy-1,4-benzoquinol methylase
MKSQNLFNIDNPVYEDLEKNILLNKKNFSLFKECTRDNNIRVIKDNKTGIIFLEKFRTDENYYRKIKLKGSDKSTKNKGNIHTKKKILNLSFLKDDERRIDQFYKQAINKRILDFGCGYGGFASRASKIASQVFVSELRTDCLNKLKKNKNLLFYDHKIKELDSIFLFHVLEHLPKQIDILKKLKKSLKKEGKIIIEVPSATDYLLNFKKFREFTFWSEHLVLHTKKSLRSFLSKAGYKNIIIKNFQRYNFVNHYNWIFNGTPGGHDTKIAHQDAAFIQKKYNKILDNLDITDTLIAIAKK